MTRLARLFDQRVRGFRVVEVAALAALAGMIFWVYLAKAEAGRERYEIGQVRQQIVDEQREVKQLRAETAHLEEYHRIQTLSHEVLGLQRVKPERETAPEALPGLAHAKAPPS
jgi:cell division protein FtsL